MTTKEAVIEIVVTIGYLIAFIGFMLVDGLLRI